jgi:hypothetical protein
MKLQTKMQELAYAVAAPNYDTWKDHMISQTFFDSVPDYGQKKEILEDKIASLQRMFDSKTRPLQAKQEIGVQREKGVQRETGAPINELKRKLPSGPSLPQNNQELPPQNNQELPFRFVAPEELLTIEEIPHECVAGVNKVNARRAFLKNDKKADPLVFLSSCCYYILSAIESGNAANHTISARFLRDKWKDLCNGDFMGCSLMIGVGTDSLFTMQQVIKTAQNKWPDKVTAKAIREVMSLNPKLRRAGSPVGGTGRKSTDDDDLSAPSNDDEVGGRKCDDLSHDDEFGGGGGGRRVRRRPDCSPDRPAAYSIRGGAGHVGWGRGESGGGHINLALILIRFRNLSSNECRSVTVSQ